MNINYALQSMVHQQIHRFGDGLQITLRERSTLRTRTSGTPTNSPTLVGAASAGDTEIVAEAASFAGSLPAGAKITLAGTEYTLAAAATVVLATSLLTLELTEGLAGNVAAGTAIDVSQPYADTVYTAMRSRADQREAADGVPDSARTYRLSARTSSGGLQTRRPKKGDVMIDADGSTTLTVTEVREAQPGATDIYWTVIVGSAR